MGTEYTDAGFWALMAVSFLLATSHSLSPDHWFPFVMVGRARRWKVSWVLGLACLAAVGHVGTSVVIGLAGVFAKKGVAADVAVWLENATPFLLMMFGFGYAAYAYYKLGTSRHGHSHGFSIVNKWLGVDPHDLMPARHDHRNETADRHRHAGDSHQHSLQGRRPSKGMRIGRINLSLHNMDVHINIPHDDHVHDGATRSEEGHAHRHAHAGAVHDHHHEHSRGDSVEGQDHRHGGQSPSTDNKGSTRAGWGLVAILGLTPCIALLPLTFAAVKYGATAIILVNTVFALSTIGTIVIFTWLGFMGLTFVRVEFFDQYGDIIAGVIIGMLGLVTKAFGL